MPYTRESAEILGLQVLGWLASDDNLFPIFQGSTGATDEDVRNGAADPAFLGSVLDFVMMDDAWVVQCCDAIDLQYESLMQARLALPGGEQVNWT